MFNFQTSDAKRKPFSVLVLDTNYQVPLTYHVTATSRAEAERVAIIAACRDIGLDASETNPFKVAEVKEQKADK